MQEMLIMLHFEWLLHIADWI